MKKLLEEYFTFSRKERIGVLVLLGLILITTLVIFYCPSSTAPIETDARQKLREQLILLDQQQDAARQGRRNGAYGHDSAADVANASFNDDEIHAAAAEAHSYSDGGEAKLAAVLFEFDPNTLSPAGWKKLGLRDKTITTIQHYLAKGGKFRKPEDLCRIYGLTPDICERLLPFVKLPAAIPDRTIWAAKDSAHAPFLRTDVRWSDKRPAQTPAVIEINAADTTAFIALRGIGSKLAARIIRFREKLGGFHHVDQVGETFGLPDSTFRQIRDQLQCNAALVRTVNINTATADSLKLHPYISWQIANAIVQYRQQHGAFKSVDQLLHINIITPEILAKAGPYLTTGEGR